MVRRGSNRGAGAAVCPDMILRIAIAASALALLAAGCGDDDGGDATADDPVTTTTAAAADEATTTTAAADAAEAATVEVVDSELGPILASEGRTLYVFVPDDGGAPTCYDACADAWPALLADGEPVAGEGVEGDLGTVARDDGGEQVTIAGWPLYFFANDAAPGDTIGQGLNDVWFVVAPDGSMVQA